MDEKLNVLQHKENTVVSSAVAGDQSSESAEQEGDVQKITDVDTDKMEVPQDGVIFSKPLSDKENPLSGSVSIDNVIVLDDGPVVITLKIRHHFTRKTKYATIRLEELTLSGLKDCVTKNGGMVSDWDALHKGLMKSISMCWWSKLIPIICGHTELGWYKSTDGLVFLHEQMIPPDGQGSQYMGNVDIKPKGSLDNIVSMIKQWILSTPEWSPLQAVIAFSVASVVLPYANLVFGKNINNLIVHLAGNSTTGKSTSLRLHVALGSNPYNETSGFWLNHQSSLDALIRRIGNNQGLPIAIDELSSSRKRAYTDFIYTFGNGGEKDRLKAGGTGLCVSSHFSTIALSSGEHSLLRKCSANTGIRVRCAELKNVKWTDSKEQADKICECLKSNYGMVAPLVAKELLNNSDLWKARWDTIYERVNSQMNKKIQLSIGSRISEYVVLFTLAAEIANKVLGIELNVNEIYDFSYRHIIIANAEQANLVEFAYEYLLRYANEHPDEFGGEQCEAEIGSYYSKKKLKGFFRQPKKRKKIGNREYPLQLAIFPDVFEEILEKKGYSPTVVSDLLHNAGLLQTKDANRDTYSLVYNDTKQNFYVLYCRREDDMMAEAIENGTYNPFGEDDYDG